MNSRERWKVRVDPKVYKKLKKIPREQSARIVQDIIDVVRTAIHEISHFVFFDILRQMERQERFTLPPDASHLLKESLTAALLKSATLFQS